MPLFILRFKITTGCDETNFGASDSALMLTLCALQMLVLLLLIPDENMFVCL